MVLKTLCMTAAGFISGSLLFSVWLARLKGRDPRAAEDHNPGALNAFRVGGWVVGVPAMLLDFVKAAVPVWAGRSVLGISGFWLVPVALAPVLGHAFSPFFRGRGGKAIAATFGVWCGLTLWQGPAVLGAGLTLGWLALESDAWSVMLGMVGLLLYALLHQGRLVLAAIWAGNVLVLVFKHRRELGRGIRPRPWLLPKPGPGTNGTGKAKDRASGSKT